MKLDRLVYRLHGPSRAVRTVAGAGVVGVVPRKRDGVPCLAIRAPNSPRTDYVDLDCIDEIVLQGRALRPAFRHMRFEEAAAQLRGFIEGSAWVATNPRRG